MSPKGPPFNFLQPAGVSQNPKGPPFKFWALDMAPTLAVLGLLLFCDSRNIVEISRIELFFSTIFVILKNSDILFGSEYKREIKILQAADNNSFLVRWNERVVIMHSYAEFIEMKRTSVNYSFAESFVCIQMRMRIFVDA